MKSGTKKFIIGIVILLALCVMAIVTMPKNDSSKNASDQQTANEPKAEEMPDLYEEYTRLPKDHRFVRQSSKEIITRFKEGSGVLFLGFKECPWCQRFAPMLNQAAEAEGIEKIYYLDIKSTSANDPAAYEQIVQLLSPYLSKDEDGLPYITTPDVSIVKDGQIIGRYELEETDDEELTPEAYWTAERIDRAVAKMRGYMKAMK